jgi:hypothetical protein
MMSGQKISAERVEEVDLLSVLLEAFFQQVLEPLAKTIITPSVSRECETPTRNQVVLKTLVETCLDEYNIKLLMTHGLKELRKEGNRTPAFPPLFVDHYNVRETLSSFWRQHFPSSKNDELTNHPEIRMNLSMAEVSFDRHPLT